MPSCPTCGSETQASHRFCGVCGAALPLPELQARFQPDIGPAPGRDSPYYISPNRVLFLTVLSYGMYFLYWMYTTWRHYRDYTGREAYPVWHALTLFVPVYSLFRVHAHVRCFNEVMEESGVRPIVTPLLAVATVLASSALGIAGFLLSGGFETTTPITLRTAVGILALNSISIAMIAAMLFRIQKSLNSYWGRAPTERRGRAQRVEIIEIVLGLLGALSWANTLFLLLSPTYRMAESL